MGITACPYRELKPGVILVYLEKKAFVKILQ
jgi:hypothetical protein